LQVLGDGRGEEGGRTNPKATKKRRGDEVEVEVESPEGVAVAD
jgi:hypothetical protein